MSPDLCLGIYSLSSTPRRLGLALAELNFWNCNVTSVNGIPLWSVRCKPSKIVYSDASRTACASLFEFERKIFHQNWSDFEQSQSSTYRELLAVSLSLKVIS